MMKEYCNAQDLNTGLSLNFYKLNFCYKFEFLIINILIINSIIITLILFFNSSLINYSNSYHSIYQVIQLEKNRNFHKSHDSNLLILNEIKSYCILILSVKFEMR